MRILYNEKHDQTDVYEYQINQGGELKVRVSNSTQRFVRIIFKNKKFYRVEHNIDDGFYNSRSYWYVVEGIANQIRVIEQRYTELPLSDEHKESEFQADLRDVERQRQAEIERDDPDLTDSPQKRLSDTDPSLQ